VTDTPKALDDLRPALADLLDSTSSTCRTDDDLAEAVDVARWLNTLATRVLGNAVVSHACGGSLPEPSRGSRGKTATLLLETEEIGDPDVQEALLNALRLQRAAAYACTAASTQIRTQ
jgi:hypothetical protein